MNSIDMYVYILYICVCNLQITHVCDTRMANGQAYATKALHIHIHDHYTTENIFGTRILNAKHDFKEEETKTIEKFPNELC